MPLLLCIRCAHAKITSCLLCFLKCRFHLSSLMPVFRGTDVLVCVFEDPFPLLVLLFASSGGCTTSPGCGWDEEAAFLLLFPPGCWGSWCSPQPYQSHWYYSVEEGADQLRLPDSVPYIKLSRGHWVPPLASYTSDPRTLTSSYPWALPSSKRWAVAASTSASSSLLSFSQQFLRIADPI